MNFNAKTIEEAKEYLQERYKELAAIKIEVTKEINYENKAIITLYNNDYASIYILEPFRGQQLYIKILQQFMLQIVTFEDCKIVSYLQSIKCNHLVLEPSKAYNIIKEHYGDKITGRTGVKLINHIDEGIKILNYIGASQQTIDAYCLHPLLQADADFNENLSCNFEGVDTAAIILAVEYRRVANSYLSSLSSDNFVGFTNNSIKEMLLADKIQNRKDFNRYHKDKHENSEKLTIYFDTWFYDLLDLTEHQVHNLTRIIYDKSPIS